MGFLGIGVGEILLILVVTLIIWGPRRIPEIARTLGRIVHAVKKVTSDLTTQITDEIEEQEKERPPKQPRGD